MARSASAWCPGGRAATKALRTSPAITASTAASTPPLARFAARRRPSGLRPLRGGAAAAPETLAGARVGLLAGLAPGRIAAIGDSLRTDVAGAAAAGIDSFFVTEGIHESELKDNGAERVDEHRLAALLAERDILPTGVMLRLRW